VCVFVCLCYSGISADVPCPAVSFRYGAMERWIDGAMERWVFVHRAIDAIAPNSLMVWFPDSLARQSRWAYHSHHASTSPSVRPCERPTAYACSRVSGGCGEEGDSVQVLTCTRSRAIDRMRTLRNCVCNSR
jgi:hypothetical protein